MADVEAHPASSGEPSPEIVQLVLDIARSLVDLPDQVSVTASEEADTTVLRLQLASSDIGKVIGRQGRTARSLRTILGAAGMKLRRRFSLDIVERN